MIVATEGHKINPSPNLVALMLIAPAKNVILRYNVLLNRPITIVSDPTDKGIN